MSVQTAPMLTGENLEELSTGASSTMSDMVAAGQTIVPQLMTSPAGMSSAAFQSNTAVNQATNVNSIGDIVKSQANDLNMTQTNMNSA